MIIDKQRSLHHTPTGSTGPHWSVTARRLRCWLDACRRPGVSRWWAYNIWDWLREMNPAKMPKFDAVVANPPFSYRRGRAGWDNDFLLELLTGTPAI